VTPLLQDTSIEVAEEAVAALAEWRVRMPASEVAAALTGAHSEAWSVDSAVRMCGRAPLIEALGARMSDGNKDVRRRAVRALHRAGARGIDAWLVPRLDDPDEEVRAAAEDALASARSDAVRARLLQRLSSRDQDERAAAVHRLGRLGAESVSAIARLAGDDSVGVRQAVASVLGDQVSQEWIDTLRTLSKDKDMRVRRETFDSIRRCSAVNLASEVIEGLKDPEAPVREAALKALRDVAPERSDLFLAALRDADLASEAWQHLVTWTPSEHGARLLPMLGSENAAERFTAVIVLGSLRAKGVREEFVRLAADPDREVRSVVARELADVPGGEAAAALRKLLEDASDDVRAEAVRALGRRGDRTAVDALSRMLDDRSEEVRGVAAQALGRLDAKNALPLLRKMADVGDTRARARVIEAIFALDPAASTRDMIGWLKRDHACLRFQALETLADHATHARAEVAAVAKSLDDADWDVRCRAVLTLRALEGPEAAVALRRALLDRNVDVRARAATALGELGERAAVEDLRALLARADREERGAVACALLELGCDDGAADVTDMLESKDERTRAEVVEMLGRIRASAWMSRLRTVLREDPDDRVRRRALESLLAIDAAANAGALVEALGDRGLMESAAFAFRLMPVEKAVEVLRPLVQDPERRDGALRALMLVGDAASIGKGLDDPRSGVRRAALAAAADWRVTDHVDRIRALARSSDVDGCILAAFALAVLRPDEAVDELRPLLRHPCVMVRQSAAEALCRAGSREGVALMLEEGHRLMAPGPDAMNALRRPHVVRRLAAARTRPAGRVPVERVVRALAESAGLKVRLEVSPADLPNSPADSWDGLLRESRYCSYSMIVEHDVVRIVDRDRAWQFWREWWEAEQKK
jgi:HEAT repeat protein